MKTKPSRQNREMMSWGSAAAQLEAKKNFAADLNGMKPAALAALLKSHAKIKTKFANCGPFYIEGQNDARWNPQSGIVRIPKTTKFHVFRNGDKEDRKQRESQVVLIVNPNGRKDEPLDEKDVQVWRCTYTPYLERRVRRRAKKVKGS